MLPLMSASEPVEPLPANPSPSPRAWLRAWKRVPRVLRQTIVLAIGLTLIATGCLLVVLPGPFTIPLLVAGVALLATEFAWATVVAEKATGHANTAKAWFQAKWQRIRGRHEKPSA